jgi:hypothetical protein
MCPSIIKECLTQVFQSKIDLGWGRRFRLPEAARTVKEGRRNRLPHPAKIHVV